MPKRFGCCGLAIWASIYIERTLLEGPEATRLARETIVGYPGGGRGRQFEIGFSTGFPNR